MAMSSQSTLGTPTEYSRTSVPSRRTAKRAGGLPESLWTQKMPGMAPALDQARRLPDRRVVETAHTFQSNDRERVGGDQCQEGEDRHRAPVVHPGGGWCGTIVANRVSAGYTTRPTYRIRIRGGERRDDRRSSRPHGGPYRGSIFVAGAPEVILSAANLRFRPRTVKLCVVGSPAGFPWGAGYPNPRQRGALPWKTPRSGRGWSRNRGRCRGSSPSSGTRPREPGDPAPGRAWACRATGLASPRPSRSSTGRGCAVDPLPRRHAGPQVEAICRQHGAEIHRRRR